MIKDISEKITAALQKFYIAFQAQKVLKTMEEVEANTNEENIPSALLLTELNNNLMFPDGTKFYPDKQGEEYGFNTDPARGADTFRPFNRFKRITFTVNASGRAVYGNYQAYPRATATITIDCKAKTVTVSNFKDIGDDQHASGGVYGQISSITVSSANFV